MVRCDLLKRCRLAGVGCPDLNGFGDGWRNAVNRHGQVDALWFDACTVKNDGEGYERCACCIMILIVFVVQLPSWRNLYEQITTDSGVVRTLGGIANARNLNEEIFRTRDNVLVREQPVFNELAVQIYLVAVACLHIAGLTVDGPKVHVQQVGRSVDVERSGWDAVFGIVNLWVFGVSRTGEYEEYPIGTYCLFDAGNERRQGLVKSAVNGL